MLLYSFAIERIPRGCISLLPTHMFPILDMDECDPSPTPCGDNSVCYNVPGSYTCECNFGFQWSGSACTGKCCCFYNVTCKVILTLLDLFFNSSPVNCPCIPCNEVNHRKLLNTWQLGASLSIFAFQNVMFARIIGKLKINFIGCSSLVIVFSEMLFSLIKTLSTVAHVPGVGN